MAPRENGGNDGDGPKPERSIATLSTLRYEIHICCYAQCAYCRHFGWINANTCCRIGVKAMIEKVGFTQRMRQISRSAQLTFINRMAKIEKQKFFPSQPAKAGQHSTCIMRSSTSVLTSGLLQKESTSLMKSNGQYQRSQSPNQSRSRPRKQIPNRPRLVRNGLVLVHTNAKHPALPSMTLP